MSSSDNDIETPHIKKDTTRSFIEKKYSDFKIIDQRDDYFILQKVDETFLVYEKKISEDIEIYLDRISNFLFAPVPVHKEDYYKIQKTLFDLDIKKCGVVIFTSHNGGAIKYISEIFFDPYYMEFVKNNKLNNKKKN